MKKLSLCFMIFCCAFYLIFRFTVGPDDTLVLAAWISMLWYRIEHKAERKGE